MTNDELQVTEIQETDAIAAVLVENEEVVAIAAVAEIAEDIADPDEEVSVEAESVAEELGEEEV